MAETEQREIVPNVRPVEIISGRSMDMKCG